MSRTTLGSLLPLPFLLLAAGAASAAAPSRIAGLGELPSVVHPGQTLVLSGRLDAPTKGALVTVSLRRSVLSEAARLVGTTRVTSSSRSFRVRLTLPSRAFGGVSTPTRYAVVACVRATPGAEPSCRTARRLTLRPVAAAPVTASSVGAPQPVTEPSTSSEPPPSPPAATSNAPAASAPSSTTPASTTPTSTTPTTAPTPTFTSGAETAGDRLFPTLGNGGYDVQSYDLALTYVPGAHVLTGTATIVAKATQDLSRFSLDFQDFQITATTVDGKTASTEREGTKLRITPPAGLLSGSTFTTVVAYTGRPPVIVDDDNSTEGFLPTNDGAFVVGEPAGAQGWFPNDNHPSDKATFKLAMTVPTGLTVVGNGLLTSKEEGPATTTWTWTEAHPMATYLATATLGRFDVKESTTASGVKLYDATDPVYGTLGSVGGAFANGAAREPDVFDLFEPIIGPYPFEDAGSIVDAAPYVTYALETQTKPNYPLPPDPVTVSHELAHQWFGDSVGLRQWQDIWLNEGFATWMQWYFGEKKNGDATTAAQFDALYAKPADDDFWKIPPAKPASPAQIFGEEVYQRGAMTLEALRQTVGDATFKTILRTWATDHRYGTVETSDFTALASRISGRDLSAFFQDWLYDADKPAPPT